MMADVVKEFSPRSAYVRRNGRCYLVSTTRRFVLFARILGTGNRIEPYETKIYRSNESEELVQWLPLKTFYHMTKKEALEHHRETLRRLENGQLAP